jgi:hypothetical protein
MCDVTLACCNMVTRFPLVYIFLTIATHVHHTKPRNVHTIIKTGGPEIVDSICSYRCNMMVQNNVNGK